MNAIMNGKRKNKSNNNAQSIGRRTRRVRVRTSVPRFGGLDPMAMAYRALLSDPCNAPLVPPVVAGPVTGLLVRQRYSVSPTGIQGVSSVNGAPMTGNFYASLKPAMAQFDWCVSTAGTQTVDLETGVLGATICQSYRPVAACIKWVPTGPINNRAGIVHTAYMPDRIVPPGGTWGDAEADKYAILCPKAISNTGMGELPEVKWLPSSPEDLDFKSRTLAYTSDTAQSLIIGRGIDGVFTNTTGSFRLNGYFDITVVWEWSPNYDSGITAAVRSGSSSTFQQVLASLGNLGQFALEKAAATTMRTLGTAASFYVGQRMVNQVTAPSFLLTG